MEDHIYSQSPEDESAAQKEGEVDGAVHAADELIQELREAAGADLTGGRTPQTAPLPPSGESAEFKPTYGTTATEPHQQPGETPNEESSDVKMPTGPAPVRTAEFDAMHRPQPAQMSASGIDLLMDVNLPVSIELGRTQLSISQILELGKGSIVELDKLAGEPVDILVNNITLAKGQVVVLDEHFGVRITSLVSHRDRLNGLGA